MIPLIKASIPSSIKSLLLNPYYDIRGLSKQINQEAIFILGNQKSGTSAIAALLAAATGLSASIDLKKEIYSPSYPEVLDGKISIGDFIRSNKFDFSKQIIKEPNLTFLFSKLEKEFPKSQFVFVVRDPRDNIRSILDRLEIPGYLPHLKSDDYSKISRSWKLILGSSKLKVYDKTGNYIEKLAKRWNYMANLFLDNSQKMILVKYEDFLLNKVNTISELALKLGLKNIYDIRDKVDIQYQKGGQRNISFENFFLKENLSKIENICSKTMEKLGYVC